MLGDACLFSTLALERPRLLPTGNGTIVRLQHQAFPIETTHRPGGAPVKCCALRIAKDCIEQAGRTIDIEQQRWFLAGLPRLERRSTRSSDGDHGNVVFPMTNHYHCQARMRGRRIETGDVEVWVICRAGAEPLGLFLFPLSSGKEDPGWQPLISCCKGPSSTAQAGVLRYPTSRGSRIGATLTESLHVTVLVGAQAVGGWTQRHDGAGDHRHLPPEILGRYLQAVAGQLRPAQAARHH